MKKCEKCDITYSDDKMFCENCGHKLVDINNTSDDKPIGFNAIKNESFKQVSHDIGHNDPIAVNNDTDKIPSDFTNNSLDMKTVSDKTINPINKEVTSPDKLGIVNEKAEWEPKVVSNASPTSTEPKTSNWDNSVKHLDPVYNIYNNNGNNGNNGSNNVSNSISNPNVITREELSQVERNMSDGVNTTQQISTLGNVYASSMDVNTTQRVSDSSNTKVSNGEFNTTQQVNNFGNNYTGKQSANNFQYASSVSPSVSPYRAVGITPNVAHENLSNGKTENSNYIVTPPLNNSSQKPINNNQNKVKGSGALKVIIILLCIMIVVLAVIIGFVLSKKMNATNINQDNSNTSTAPQDSNTFNFNDFQITVGNQYTLVRLDNNPQYQGQDIIKLPITLTNNSSNTNTLLASNYTFVSPTGESLDSLGTYFDDSVESSAALASNETITKYFYILYKDKGDYKINFNNGSQQVNFALTIK